MSTEEGGPEGGLIEFPRTVQTFPGSVDPTRPRPGLPYSEGQEMLTTKEYAPDGY